MMTSASAASCTEASSANIADDEQVLPEEGVPWYHVQLYRLYGKEADYFLYPKQISEKRERAQTDAKISSLVRKNFASIGVSGLWTKLRNDSQSKLRNVESTVRPQLKHAYQSYVREYVNSQQAGGKSCIFSDRDVPGLHELVNHSQHNYLLSRRRATQVMWRASRKNENNASVLIHNSPLPQLNRCSGNDSIAQLLPASDQVADGAYPGSADKCLPEIPQPKINRRKTLSPITDSTLERCDEAKQQKQQVPLKLVFLTDEDVHKALITRRSTDLDAAALLQRSVKEQNWMVREQQHRQAASAAVHEDNSQDSERARRQLTQHESWQPLTLGALLDYKTERGVSQRLSSHQRMWTVN